MAKIISAGVLGIGLLALYQKITIFGPTADHPLIIDFNSSNPNEFGHMALQSAFIISILGLSLLLNSYNRFLNKISTFLNAGVFFISLIGLIELIFQADSFSQIESALRISEQPAISGLLISFAGFFVYPQNKYVSILS